MNAPFARSFAFGVILILFVLHAAACRKDEPAKRGPDPTPIPTGSIFVIGGIHQSHEEASIYTYERMGELFRALSPEVFCVEVRQKFVEDGSLKGMPFDFKRAMVPAAREMGVPMVGIDWWDDTRGAQWQRLQREAAEDESIRPELEVVGSLFANLNDFFKHRDFADINASSVTRLWAAKNRFKYRTLAAHPAYAPVVAYENDRNEHMAENVLTAVRGNPGKRILVAVGIDHKYFIEEYLTARSVRVVQAEDLVQDEGTGS
jgi:hypothetical protein